jgi:ankyrin repeat protein
MLMQTALHLAVITRVDRILEQLLLFGASPSVPNKLGHTGCHLAVKNGDVRLLRIILHRDTTAINILDFEGNQKLV